MRIEASVTNYFSYQFLEYVEQVKNVLFMSNKQELSTIMERYRGKAPEPLCSQFPTKRSKAEAIKKYVARNKHVSHALYPCCKYGIMVLFTIILGCNDLHFFLSGTAKTAVTRPNR